MPTIRAIIDDAASTSGIDADYLARIAKIESGMNPNNRTGSYHGLFQLSPSEFQRYGGRNIYDPADNARAAASMMADQRNEFTSKYGRPPTPTEAYLVHQQGAAGLDAHLANPDAPAWQNMASTGEGKQKGEAWARRAIWGNIPDSLKSQFGSVDNVSSADFINKVWRPHVEGDSAPASGDDARPTGSPAGLPVDAGDLPEASSGSAQGAGAPPASAPSTPSGLLGALGMLGSSSLANQFGPGLGILNAGQQAPQPQPMFPMPPMPTANGTPAAQMLKAQILARAINPQQGSL